jgi:hypothetical protein
MAIQWGDGYWFSQTHKGLELSRVVLDTVKAIVDEQAGIRQRWEKHASLYLDREVSANRDAIGTGPGFLDLDADTSYGDDLDNAVDWPGWNVCKAIPDAVHARLLLNPPRPKIVVEDAPETVHYAADLADRFAYAAMLQSRFYGDNLKRWVKFGLVLGSGYMKILPDELTNDICIAVYSPDRIVIDQKTVRPGFGPLCIFHVDWVDRAQLLATFANNKAARATIELSEPQTSGGVVHHDLVMVVDAWMAAVGEQKGRRALVTDKGVLLDLQHTRKRLPFARYAYQAPLAGGTYGESINEPIVGIQRDINYTVLQLRQNLRTMGSRLIGVDDEQMVKGHKLDTDTIIEGAGRQGLHVINPPLANPQVFDYLQMQYAKAGELTRTTELMRPAAGLKRLESGAALETQHEINSEAFVEAFQALEQGTIDAGELLIAAGRDIDKRGGWNVRDTSMGVLDTIPWKKVDPGENRMQVSVHASSRLPSSLSGRLSHIERIIDAGMITDPAEGLDALDIPDLSKLVAHRTAAERSFKRHFEAILAGEDYDDHRPDPLVQNLQRGIVIAQQYHERHRWARGMSKVALFNIKQWIEEAVDLLAAQAPEPTQAVELSPDQQALGAGGGNGVPPGASEAGLPLNTEPPLGAIPS